MQQDNKPDDEADKMEKGESPKASQPPSPPSEDLPKKKESGVSSRPRFGQTVKAKRGKGAEEARTPPQKAVALRKAEAKIQELEQQLKSKNSGLGTAAQAASTPGIEEAADTSTAKAADTSAAKASESDTGQKKPGKSQEEAFSLRHGKFVTDGGVQEFVHIPATDASVMSAKSGELFDEILRHWNLPRPHLLIKFQSGFAHPKHLLNTKEIDKLDKSSDIYQYFVYFRDCVAKKEDVQKQVDATRAELTRKRDALRRRLDDSHPKESVDGQNEESSPSSHKAGQGNEKQDIQEELKDVEEKLSDVWEEVLKEKTLEPLNEFLYRSLSNLIDVIVRACVRNRCWILVEGGPTGGLLLLKQAAENCVEKPTILVLDSFKKSRYPYEQVRKKVEESQEFRDDFLKAGLQQVSHLSDLNEKGANRDEVVKAMAKKMAVKSLEKEKKNEKDKSAKGQVGEQTSMKNEKDSSKAKEDVWQGDEDWEKVEEINVLSALMTAQLLDHAKPMNQPIVTPLKLDMKFWNKELEKAGWTCKSAKEKEAGKVAWNRWHFRGGTHYILCDDHHHALVLHSLAPSGCIFLGGGDSSKKELLKMLVSGQPVVCLNNTGRLTQEFVRCHYFLCSELFRMAHHDDDKPSRKPRAKRDDDKSSRRDAPQAPMLTKSKGSEMLQVLQRGKEKEDYLGNNIRKKTVFKALTIDGDLGVVERKGLVVNMQAALSEVTEFTQPELCELFLTYLRRGLQITKLCVVMDPLNPRECSGGHTEDKLSMCLSNFVILASNDTSDFADVEAVKAASKLRLQLVGAAKVEQRWALTMVYLLALLNLVSLLLALAEKGGTVSNMPWLPVGILGWGLPAVSALSTFISGLVARFRFTLRWSKAQSAAAHLEAEIWKFRTRVSDYTVVGGSRNPGDLHAEEGERKSEEQAFTRERKQDETRKLFRDNVTNIFNSAMEEMGTSSLHNGFNDELKLRNQEQSDPKPRCCQRCCPRRNRQEDKDPDSADQTSGNLAPDQEDLTMYGHIGIDDYYRKRTLDVLERMKDQAFWLTFKQGALESFVLLFGTSGVLLSTFGQTDLAMVTVSLAASLQSLERFHALSTRLDAANAGERDMICAWQDWSAMEPMQRRFQSNVSRLVLTTEGVNVALTSAATAGVRQSLAKKPS